MSAVSDAAKANKRQYQLDRYRWYRDHGICVNCYKTFSEPGRAYCRECYRRIRARQKKADPDGSINRQRNQQRRDRLKSSGMCVTCGQRAAVPGRSLCPACAEKNSQSGFNYRLRKRLKGETP